ncbi:hypothetical protein AZE42_05637 [Rhizopogon vesiculosus]|uniref:Uncharacterized protein n=1 Tax=Rhizopogon vesiculosus TaxID=180088 RepID=A0A1J8R2X2_9AGAM|nr:hypothetical protein AZE42_05637 [Rhizopogon vesiculosus]
MYNISWLVEIVEKDRWNVELNRNTTVFDVRRIGNSFVGLVFNVEDKKETSLVVFWTVAPPLSSLSAFFTIGIDVLGASLALTGHLFKTLW